MSNYKHVRKQKSRTVYWKPTADYKGMGSCRIRFLPECGGESCPFVEDKKWYIKREGQWYVEPVLFVDDPVERYMNETGDFDFAKPSVGYLSNVYVYEDVHTQEFNETVGIYRYPRTIFKMIENMFIPSKIDDHEPCNVFCMDSGRDFNMKFYQDGGFRTYEKSNFAEPSKFLDNDLDQKIIWDKQVPLNTLVEQPNIDYVNEKFTKFLEKVGLK